MDTEAKLQLLASQMNLEPAEETSALGSPNARGVCGHSPNEIQTALNENKNDALMIHNARLPGGKTTPMLKTMLTSACERDCLYCPFRAGRDFRRATFKPEEMANAFAEMNKAKMVDGIFLSSGIAAGGVRTQDKLLDTIDIIRKKKFTGYIHLKIMPGAEKDQVLRAMQLADRVSVNLEAPNAERLLKLAPHKIFWEELMRPLQWAHEIRSTLPAHQNIKGKWPSLVTQFVVGAAGENDLEVLSATAQLTQHIRLARAYFSAFHPIRDTPLENLPPENPLREHRLYQSSFLLRDYGFDLEDMPFDRGGNLPLDVDPKIAWAAANLNDSPVEVNRADRRSLLRVPGIGPKGVESILVARRRGLLTDLRDLKSLGVIASRAAPYILLNGKQPTRQLSLF
ncbi:MAG: radical SAM protein [Chloroflexi bacterium]|nr:radical SAM protein [Chloroflexota bacterium]